MKEKAEMLTAAVCQLGWMSANSLILPWGHSLSHCSYPGLHTRRQIHLIKHKEANSEYMWMKKNAFIMCVFVVLYVKLLCDGLNHIILFYLKTNSFSFVNLLTWTHRPRPAKQEKMISWAAQEEKQRPLLSVTSSRLKPTDSLSSPLKHELVLIVTLPLPPQSRGWEPFEQLQSTCGWNSESWMWCSSYISTWGVKLCEVVIRVKKHVRTAGDCVGSQENL